MLCRNRFIRYTILQRRVKHILEQQAGLTRTAAAACRARRLTHRSSDTLCTDAPRHVSLANAHKIRLSETRRLAGAVDFRRFVVRCRLSPHAACLGHPVSLLLYAADVGFQACDRTRVSVVLAVRSEGGAPLVLEVIIGVHHSDGILTKIAHAGTW